MDRAAFAAVLTVLVAASPAAGATHAAADRSFVGGVSGTDAFVAVVVHGSHVTAYACDSKKIAQWFKGDAHAGSATLTSKSGYVLRMTIGARQVSGLLRVPGHNGAVHRVHAVRASKPAGLYRGETRVAGRRYLGGWIIRSDGRQRGEVVSGTTAIASPTLDPNDPTVEIKRGKKKPLIVIIAILIG